MSARSIPSLPQALFNDAKCGYVVLASFAPWKAKPKHCLSIPAQWEKEWCADYDIDGLDFMSRKMALVVCASQNRKAMEEELPDEWSIVVQFGGWHAGSFLHFISRADAS